jgi:cell wall assembly regulator SMI1
MNVFERLRAAWLAADVQINPGADPAEIAAFESKHCVKLPLDFKDYLMLVNGMADGAADDQLISFLSLNAIDREVSQRGTPPQRCDLVFAEYLIHSHVYVIRELPFSKQASVFAADGAHERRLAGSFAEFLERYLASPEAVGATALNDSR